MLPSSILIFPNPSNGVFYINCLDSGLNYKSAQMVVRNMEGRIVFQQDLKLQADLKIDISFLSSSMYSVKFYIEQTSVTKNIIIQ